MGVTPVYGLDYPDALDAPCDFDTDWCTFTDSIETILDRMELGAQRVLPAIPIAKVRLTEQTVVPEGSAIPWDTLSVDTPGWTNFDVNNQIITISRAARYSVSAYALMAPQGVVNASYLTTIAGFSYLSMEALDRNTSDVGITVKAESLPLSAGQLITMAISRSGSIGDITIRVAGLTVFWHADTERLS